METNQHRVNAVTLNDITIQKLRGIVNKIDVAAMSDEDSALKQQVEQILEAQRKIADHLENMG